MSKYVYNKTIEDYDEEKIQDFETIIIKQNYDRVNFIDKNDIYIGFDFYQQCCESFGYYISNEVDSEAISIYKIKGYYFDTKKSLEKKLKINDNSACIKLINDKNEYLYLHLYNNHNGYYCHEVWIEKDDDGFRYCL